MEKRLTTDEEWSSVVALCLIATPAFHNMIRISLWSCPSFLWLWQDASKIATSYAAKLSQDGGKFVALQLDVYNEYPDDL